MQTAATADLRALLPDESPSDYRAHLAGLMKSFQPADYYEELLVQEFADASWAWRRARAVEAAHLHHVGTSYYRGPRGIAEALFYVPENHFRNHRRYMLDAERRYERARRAVEEIRRRRDQGQAQTKKRNEPAAPRPSFQLVKNKRTQAAASAVQNEANSPAGAEARALLSS